MATTEIGMFMYGRYSDPLFAIVENSAFALGAIYEGIGYLVHFNLDEYTPEQALTPLLEYFLEDVQDRSQLEIYLSGGSFTGAESIIMERAQIVEALRDLGYGSCIKQIKWDNTGRGQLIKVSPRNLRVSIESFFAEPNASSRRREPVIMRRRLSR